MPRPAAALGSGYDRRNAPPILVRAPFDALDRGQFSADGSAELSQ